MNYNEYFGKNPNAGWGTSGARDTNNEDWSKYFQPGTQQVPIKKVYSDSPVVVDKQNGQVRTYMDVDPVVVERPTHEQMLMHQQQMAASRRLAEEQKAYYDKMWANKVSQMEDDGLGSDAPVGQKTVKKLSFVNKPKADVVEEQKPVTIDPMNKPVNAPGYEQNETLAPEQMEQAKAALIEAARKYDAEQKALEEMNGENIHHIEPVAEGTLDNEPEDVNVENEIRNETGIGNGSIAVALDSEDDVEELKNDLIDAGVPEDAIEEEPIEPILAGDAEVEDIIEEETADETADDFDNVLGGLDADDVSTDEPADIPVTPEDDAVPENIPEDVPEDLPGDIEDMNIDMEYEAERNARIAEQERLAKEAEKAEKKTTAKRSKKKTDAAEPKRKKPVVTTKKKKSTK